jgi:hypothetical protein
MAAFEMLAERMPARARADVAYAGYVRRDPMSQIQLRPGRVNPYAIYDRLRAVATYRATIRGPVRLPVAAATGTARVTRRQPVDPSVCRASGCGSVPVRGRPGRSPLAPSAPVVT